MNKKFKKILATVSAVAMCAVSAVSVSAGALYTPTDKEVRPETTSFNARVYGENIKFHLWQEATDYFDDEDVKMYISDKFVNWMGEEYTYQMLSHHMVYRNSPDGILHDYCSVGLFAGVESYCLNEEDKAALEKYLSDNNIEYKINESGNIRIKGTTNDEEYFKALQKIKDDTGFTVNWLVLDSMIEITDAENPLPAVTLSGDTNEDGDITIADAVLIMQSLSNPDKYQLTPQGTANADTNGDGGVTAADSLKIQEMLADK